MLTPFGELPNRLASGMTMGEQYDWLRRPLSRRALLRGAGVAGASSALLWSQTGTTRADGSQIYGRHVTYGSDPRSQMIVGAASATAVRAVTVHLSGGPSAAAEIQSVAGSSASYFRARFDHLSHDTRYDYTIESDGARANGGTFRTAASGRPSFRFTAFGDQDVGPESAALLARVASLSPQLHVLAGDLCYADQSGLGGPGDVLRPQRWDRWLTQNEPVASRTPWLIVPGNHEMESGYGPHGYAGLLARVAVGGSSPIAVPVASTYRVGTVAFVGLDSNDVAYEIPANREWTRGAQTAWLEAQLAAYRRAGSGVEFIVVYMHASPYSTSSTHGSEGGILEHWVPLFDRYSVDLAISGHNHCYERTLPLRAHAVVSPERTEVQSAAGTSYVTIGGGGAALVPNAQRDRGWTRVATAAGPESVRADWSLAPPALEHCVLCVDVHPGPIGARSRMHLRSLTAAGQVLDEWELVRPAGPATEATALSQIWPAATAAVTAGAGVGITLSALRRAGGPDALAEPIIPTAQP